MTDPQPEKIGESRAYWIHKVDNYPHPVAQFRMSQLVDYDPRLTEPARTVYRFLVGWYMDEHGDALASVRKIVGAMRGRAPDGARHLSRSAAQRAIVLLVDNNWLTRKELGKGRRGSRYVPVANVLELAAMGQLPDSVPVERDATDESSVPVERDACVPVERDTTGASVPHGGTKTRIQDAVTKTRVPVDIDIPPVADAHSGAAPGDGFERLRAAYDKPDDARGKAKRAFNDVAPDAAEVERMVKSATSWKRTSTGNRMSLERWIVEKRWLRNDEFANDNRKTHKWPSCVVTWVKPKYDEDEFIDTLTFKYRDRDGLLQTRVLDGYEFDEFRDQVKADRPRVCDPSKDMHEFIGARFQADDDGMFSQYLKEAA